MTRPTLWWSTLPGATSSREDFSGASLRLRGRDLAVEVNGSPFAFDEQDTADIASDGSGISQEVSTIVQLNAGDVISLSAIQTTGSNASSLAVFGGKVVAPQLQAEWVAP
ncbi:hypothetical protein QFZ67_004238 [Streptomyces sp. V1I1]|nr:hypothetical protein [Streptomyces sp. V1I1]